MTEIIVFSGIGMVVVVLVGWTILRQSSQNTEREVFLSLNGFAPCEEEREDLLKNVLSLERNAEYRYSIEAPFKTVQGGKTVHFYQKNRKRERQLYAVEEFQFSFPRKSTHPFMVYLKPESLGEGVATRLLKSLTSMAWDAHPDDLVRMDLPDHQHACILNAFGPEGTSLHDLVESDPLEQIAQGGNHGILIVRFNGTRCSLEYMRKLPGADLKKSWSFIQKMMKAASAHTRNPTLVSS